MRCSRATGGREGGDHAALDKAAHRAGGGDVVREEGGDAGQEAR
jgi:hypothetical protein